MHLHEYQAKELLKEYVNSPTFEVLSSLDQLESALDALKTNEVVLKVQVHAGGRGKAGGVKLAKKRNEIEAHARDLMGKKIVTPQTGSMGLVSSKILISPQIKYLKEYYIGVLIDRKKAQAVLLISPEGGMEIEEIAEKHPAAIHAEQIPLNGKIRSYRLLTMAKFMGWNEPTQRRNGMILLQNVCRAFLELDASLLEINPLVLLQDNSFMALDAKMTIDDNALFRHPKLAHYFDETQISPMEAMSRKFELAYIALDGDIGCMVNGAGLAMATMDIIEYYGGKPANFLDVGGGATQEKVTQGFNILLSDPKVKAILVNIFGGIMNCETIALGLIAAVKEKGVKVPIVVRLEGTNVETGKKILKDSGLKMHVANTLEEAAEAIVKAAKGES